MKRRRRKKITREADVTTLDLNRDTSASSFGVCISYLEKQMTRALRKVG